MCCSAARYLNSDSFIYLGCESEIYTWTGEKDLAIIEIAAIERVPNYLTYGLLKLHPYWDPLRGDPRCERIVAALAPKD